MITTILQKRSAKAKSKEAKDRKKRAIDEVQNQTVEAMRSTKTSKLFQPTKGILDVAIADFVHAEGVTPAAVHSPRFRKVLETYAGLANRCPSFTPESQEENAPRLAPPRVFVNHLEPFEESKYMKKEDGPLTARLRRKYVGVRFFDDDEDDHFEIVGVVFKKTSARKGCYCVTVQLVQELGGDVVDDDPETYIINEELHRMVSLEVQTSGIQLSEQ